MLVRVIVRVRARGPGSGGPGSGGPWAEGEGSGARDARGPDAWGRRVGQAEGPRGCVAQGNGLKLNIFPLVSTPVRGVTWYVVRST